MAETFLWYLAFVWFCCERYTAQTKTQKQEKHEKEMNESRKIYAHNPLPLIR
jgi:hypothetical protein